MSPRALIRDPRTDRWLAYTAPVAVLRARSLGDVARVVRETEARCRRERLHAVGFLTYEAAAALAPTLPAHAPGRLPPAWFALFREPRPAAAPCPLPRPPLKWQESVDRAAYHDALARIRGYIAAGDSYQVNFSYRLRAAVGHAGLNAAADLFAAMIARQPAGLGAFIDTDAWAICSASHELFFARQGRRVVCRPMKGTAPRGATPAEDACQARWLAESVKNRAENLMITDMARNDLGRLADTGSVRTEALFRLEPYPTLWQLTSTVRAETDADIGGILEALFPAASITGAPKRRTMAIIRELEPDPREIYTGTIGVIHPDGDARFNVAIRTAWLDKLRGVAEYGVGGGILWDSDVAEEYRETRLKARILTPEAQDGFSLLETLLWTPGEGFQHLDGHLARLTRAAAFFFRERLPEARVRARLDALAAGLTRSAHRIRLLVDADLSVTLQAAPLDDAARPQRVALVRAPGPLIGNPFVTHKTTRRDLYECARRHAAAAVPGADDALLVNERGEVTESTLANLVVDLAGTLVTPPVSSGLLPGVYRQHLLDAGRVVERVLRPEDLERARHLYLANSVRGLWPVQLLGSAAPVSPGDAVRCR